MLILLLFLRWDSSSGCWGFFKWANELLLFRCRTTAAAAVAVRTVVAALIADDNFRRKHKMMKKWNSFLFFVLLFSRNVRPTWHLINRRPKKKKKKSQVNCVFQPFLAPPFSQSVSQSVGWLLISSGWFNWEKDTEPHPGTLLHRYTTLASSPLLSLFFLFLLLGRGPVRSIDDSALLFFF